MIGFVIDCTHYRIDFVLKGAQKIPLLQCRIRDSTSGRWECEVATRIFQAGKLARESPLPDCSFDGGCDRVLVHSFAEDIIIAPQ